MNKRICSLILAITIMGTLVTPVMATETLSQTNIAEAIHLQIGSQNVTVKGQEYVLNTSPQIIKGTTFVPLRLIMQALDVRAAWFKESQKIVMTKGNQKIELKLGSKEAIIDGRNVPIGIAPIEQNGNTLVPLRFITDQFNLALTYNNETKKIVLRPLVPPIAKFKIEGDRHIAGREISVVNESYSQGGESIVASLWQINGNNKSIHTKDLKKELKILKAGTYHIKLQVRNSNKAWSEWNEQEIVIEPHPKPVIGSFIPTKTNWDQGEQLSFEYKTVLEPWANMTDTRWTYQLEGESKKTFGEPRALFKEGTYTVSLEIKDDYDTWSMPATTQVNITNKAKSTELEFKFNDVKYGETVDNYNGYNFQNYEPVENFLVERKGPTLLFSNSPETVTKKGILYADKVVGDTRILYHHRNGIQRGLADSRLVIAVENKGREPVTITAKKKINAGPSNDILHLGQIATRRYFKSNADEKIVLKPHEKRYLYDTGKTKWTDYESFSGIFEFHSDKIITVTIAAVDKEFKIGNLDKLPILARDGIHTRGTFPDANKYYNILIPEDRPSKLLLGQQADKMDSWIDGYDALTGSKEKNKGNYGVLYELELTSDARTGVLLNPRGTSFKGAFKWDDVMVATAPDQGVFVGSRESAVVGVTEKRVTRKLYYTLSNGSSGPVLFNFIPEKFWDNHKIEKDMN